MVPRRISFIYFFAAVDIIFGFDFLSFNSSQGNTVASNSGIWRTNLILSASTSSSLSQSSKSFMVQESVITKADLIVTISSLHNMPLNLTSATSELERRSLENLNTFWSIEYFTTRIQESGFSWQTKKVSTTPLVQLSGLSSENDLVLKTSLSLAFTSLESPTYRLTSSYEEQSKPNSTSISFRLYNTKGTFLPVSTHILDETLTLGNTKTSGIRSLSSSSTAMYEPTEVKLVSSDIIKNYTHGQIAMEALFLSSSNYSPSLDILSNASPLTILKTPKFTSFLSSTVDRERAEVTDMTMQKRTSTAVNKFLQTSSSKTPFLDIFIPSVGQQNYTRPASHESLVSFPSKSLSIASDISVNKGWNVGLTSNLPWLKTLQDSRVDDRRSTSTPAITLKITISSSGQLNYFFPTSKIQSYIKPTPSHRLRNNESRTTKESITEEAFSKNSINSLFLSTTFTGRLIIVKEKNTLNSNMGSIQPLSTQTSFGIPVRLTQTRVSLSTAVQHFESKGELLKTDFLLSQGSHTIKTLEVRSTNQDKLFSSRVNTKHHSTNNTMSFQASVISNSTYFQYIEQTSAYEAIRPETSVAPVPKAPSSASASLLTSFVAVAKENGNDTTNAANLVPIISAAVGGVLFLASAVFIFIRCTRKCHGEFIPSGAIPATAKDDGWIFKHIDRLPSILDVPPPRVRAKRPIRRSKIPNGKPPIESEA